MKKMIKLIISIILVATLTVTSVVPSNAARPGTKFLSELHMAEADSEDAAKKMLTDAGYTVFNKNLNPDGAKAVFLGYKTSTDVEDAITDISVMNMNGGYSISDYETILQDSFDEYQAMVDNFRIAANEFAANYAKGTKEAKLAYRQLNYYYDEQPVLNEKGEKELDEDGNPKTVKTKMGDYMLAFPEKDEDFANVLMKGNMHILSNIRNLLAMGCGEPDVSLVDKIGEATKDPAVYDKVEYYEEAKIVYKTIVGIDQDIQDAEVRIEEVKADETLTDEEKDMVISGIQNSTTNLVAFKVILESIPYQDTTYGEYMKEHPLTENDYSVLYPILEGMTPGQRALVSFGQVTSILIYDRVEKNEADLEKELAEMEEDFVELSVYTGTDMEIYESSFAVTTAALQREAATGESWVNETLSNDKPSLSVFGAVVLGTGGCMFTAASAMVLYSEFQQVAESAALYQDLVADVTDLSARIAKWKQDIADVKAIYDGIQNMPQHSLNFIKSREGMISTCTTEYRQAANQLVDFNQYTISTSAVVFSSIGLAIGAAMIGYSIYNIIKIIDSHNVKYTEIPANMVESVETENGDRYIRYSAVDSFYKAGDEIKTKAGDTNGYEGKQWNAIYYTKNYEAGKCMLASADWPTAEADFGKYAPVHAFGQKSICYNLNRFAGEDTDTKIFLAFQTSNAQKAAESSVPTIVGSAFNYGITAIAAVVGIGIGMGIMAIIKRKKEK